MILQSIYNYKKHILIDIVSLYFDLDIIFQWKYYISIEIALSYTGSTLRTDLSFFHPLNHGKYHADYSAMYIDFFVRHC